MFKPFLIPVKYPVGDIPVGLVNAADYHPDATGREDAAPAIQMAVDACAENGGGVVYLPEGKYALRTPLEIKTAVTLRGEWIDPDVEPNAGRGTILCCYYGRNDENGKPQVTMDPCTGIRNMTFYYPEQTYTDPVPYSPCVRQDAVDSITLDRVTMVNPWLGIQAGPDANELHTLRRVYISPVHVGFFMDMTTDIGRMERLYIGPKYWEEFTLSREDSPMNDPERKGLESFMFKNSVGVYMARSDWEYGTDIYIEGCNIGFLITSFKDSGPNTQLSQLRIHNCNTGFQLINVNPYGVALSDSSITTDIGGRAAIESFGKFKTLMQCNNVDFGGAYENLVIHNGSGQISFVNCNFTDWAADGAAVLQKLGGLSLEQCTFRGEGEHVVLEDGIGGMQILGCDFGGPMRMTASEKAREELLFSDEPLNLSVAPRGGHKPCPRIPQASAAVLYNAADFGAVADGKTDNTAAVNAALKAAGETGGIVYLTGGFYSFDGTLDVPAGVELRGVFDVPSHTLGDGTALLIHSGRGDENGEPFIKLGDGAGVRGLSLYYPEQSPADPVPYSWTVQSRGKNCFAIDTVFVNSWIGLDFGTYPSEGHYVNYIGGAPIRIGVFLGNNSGEGWVEDIQYNPHYWFRTNLPNRPVGNEWHAFWHHQIEYLDALKFGYNEKEHLLNTFVFAAKHGLYFTLQDGRGTKGTFIGHGTDGGEIGLYIDGVDDVDLINTELVSIESPRTRIYFLTAENMVGKARVYNTLLWGYPHYAVVLQGGDIDFQQSNYVKEGNIGTVITGGKNIISAAHFFENTSNVKTTGGNTRLVGCMAARRDPLREKCAPALDIDAAPDTLIDELNWSK